jgi:hypothetical protein
MGLITYNNSYMAQDEAGNSLGKRLPMPVKTHDGRTVDSTGAFLVGELERLDQKLHEPLVSLTWGRDIDLREDVTIADETSSFTTSMYGSAGGLGTGQGLGNGKAWIGKDTNEISGVSLDINKIPHELRPWALEVKYSILELESAAKLGRPVDEQKTAALKMKHQMDIEEMVYIGDTGFLEKGLLNQSAVTPTNLPNGSVSASPKWVAAAKTPDDILADVNAALTTVWAASAWAVMPNQLRIPPAQFGYISTAKVSSAGNVSILKYIRDNNILSTTGNGALNIQPLKWCIGAAVGGTLGTLGTGDRMVVYNKNPEYVRYPMTLLQRTQLQYDSIFHKMTYFCRLGVMELVYPSTIGYFDGL